MLTCRGYGCSLLWPRGLQTNGVWLLVLQVLLLLLRLACLHCLLLTSARMLALGFLLHQCPAHSLLLLLLLLLLLRLGAGWCMLSCQAKAATFHDSKTLLLLLLRLLLWLLLSTCRLLVGAKCCVRPLGIHGPPILCEALEDVLTCCCRHCCCWRCCCELCSCRGSSSCWCCRCCWSCWPLL
jgi:hypothetical protein